MSDLQELRERLRAKAEELHHTMTVQNIEGEHPRLFITAIESALLEAYEKGLEDGKKI
jgi:hypothetical protein